MERALLIVLALTVGASAAAEPLTRRDRVAIRAAVNNTHDLWTDSPGYYSISYRVGPNDFVTHQKTAVELPRALGSFPPGTRCYTFACALHTQHLMRGSPMTPPVFKDRELTGTLIQVPRGRGPTGTVKYGTPMVLGQDLVIRELASGEGS